MPTDTQRQLIRRETGDSLTSFPDDDVDLLYAKAESEYSAYTAKVHFQAVIVYRVEELLTASIPDVTYKQNDTSENRSDIRKGLEEKLARAQKRFEELKADEPNSAVAIGTLRKMPATRREYPRS